MTPKRPLMHTVAANLRRLRHQMGLNTLEMAERCLIHANTLARAESGCDIRLTTLDTIATGIGVSITYLLENHDND